MGIKFFKNKKDKKSKKYNGEVSTSSVVHEPGELIYEPPVPIFPISINSELEEKIHADSTCNTELSSVVDPHLAASCKKNADCSAQDAPEPTELSGTAESGVLVVSSEKTPESQLEGQQLPPVEVPAECDVPEAMPSLLANGAFIKLVEECVEVMDEFEAYVHRLPSREEKEIAELVVHRMQEVLERSGLERIADEEHFSILRHRSDPVVPVTDGHPLAETLVAGLSIENRVFKRAIVKLKKEDADAVS